MLALVNLKKTLKCPERHKIIMNSPQLLQYFGGVSFQNLLTVQYFLVADLLYSHHFSA